MQYALDVVATVKKKHEALRNISNVFNVLESIVASVHVLMSRNQGSLVRGKIQVIHG